MRGSQVSTQKIACRRSHRNGQIENAKYAPAFTFRKKVGHERGRDGHECRLAYANQSMANQQFSIGVSDRGEQRESAPENGADYDD